MKRDLALWVGVLGGAIVWALVFVAKFCLSYWICVSRWMPGAVALSLVALALTAGAWWLSWSQWQELGREYPGQGGDVVSRSRALAFGGVLLNGMFFLVLVANTLPELMMRGCE